MKQERVNKRVTALTIEELAERTGLSVRNIRAYQAKHLLHPGQFHGPRGYYDDSHIERITLIRRLQEEGFNLDAARILIEQGEAFTTEVERLRHDLGFEGLRADDESWVPMSDAALQIVNNNSAETLERLVEAEIVRRDENDQLWVRSAFRIGWRLFELGLPHEALYDLLFAVDQQARPLGRLYADLVDQNLLVETRDQAVAEPVTDITKILEQYEELTVVAVQLMTAAFEVAVRREFRRALDARLRGRDIAHR